MPGALEVSIGPRICSPKLHQLSFAGRFCDLVEKLGECKERKAETTTHCSRRLARHDTTRFHHPFLSLFFSSILCSSGTKARQGKVRPSATAWASRVLGLHQRRQRSGRHPASVAKQETRKEPEQEEDRLLLSLGDSVYLPTYLPIYLSKSHSFSRPFIHHHLIILSSYHPSAASPLSPVFLAKPL